jgi:hypothetical protein
MTEATDTFAELTRQGHQVFSTAIQAWEQAARSMTGAAAGRPGTQLPDVGASVDAAFDFAVQMLADQREFTRTLMSAGAQAFATAARRPEAEGGDEPAGGPAVQPAQDADQPGADAVAAPAPSPPPPPPSPAPSPAPTGDDTGPGRETTAAPRKTPAAKRTTAGRATTGGAARKATAEKTTARRTPAKRGAPPSGGPS